MLPQIVLPSSLSTPVLYVVNSNSDYLPSDLDRWKVVIFLQMLGRSGAGIRTLNCVKVSQGLNT